MATALQRNRQDVPFLSQFGFQSHVTAPDEEESKITPHYLRDDLCKHGLILSLQMLV